MTRSKLDRVRLDGLEVDCIVGLYPNERAKQQPLQLTVDLYFDSRPAGGGAGLSASVDYARLCGEIRFLLESSRFVLLEEAAEALARYTLAEPTADAPRAQIQEVVITVKKPRALGGIAVPSLRVYRHQQDVACEVETQNFGRVDVIYEANRCGIYRLRLAPGSVIAPHAHQQMEEHELIMGSGLTLQNEPVVAGTARSWPKGFTHTYANVSDVEQTILCVDRPRFIAADEVANTKPLDSLAEIDVKQYYASLP